jgi:hypothetical protein
MKTPYFVCFVNFFLSKIKSFYMKQLVLCLLVAIAAMFTPQQAFAILAMPHQVTATTAAQSTNITQNVAKKSFFARTNEQIRQSTFVKKWEARGNSFKDMMGNNTFRMGAILAIVGLIVSILLGGLLGRLGSLALAVGLVIMALAYLDVI